MHRRDHDPREMGAADHYRREAARLRELADASTFSEVKHDLVVIAREYEDLAQQRDDVAKRYGGN